MALQAASALDSVVAGAVEAVLLSVAAVLSEVGTSPLAARRPAVTQSLAVVVVDAAEVVSADGAVIEEAEAEAAVVTEVALAKPTVRRPVRTRRRRLLPQAGVTLRGMLLSRSGRGRRTTGGGMRVLRELTAARLPPTLARCTPEESGCATTTLLASFAGA